MLHPFLLLLIIMKVNIIYPILAILIIIFVVKKCEQDPKVITKTKIEYVKVTDTILRTVIDSVPKIVYVKKTKTVKGKDSIVYVKEPNDSTIQANQYNTQLQSNNATADLKITTTGELLDVQGVINYTQTNTTTETIKTKPKSGLFLYGETSINPMFERAALGIDYQIKNTIIVGASTSYNNVSKHVNFNVKVGLRLF